MFLDLMKTTKMRIVCGTDFSLHAAQAANVAAELAMRLDGAVVLIHVVENSVRGAVSPKVFDKLMGDLRERLHEEGNRLRKLGATVREEFRNGSPYETLVEAGRQPGTRVLVVSSLGRIAPSRFLVGSVAERTAENSPVPTLIVRDDAPFRAWARGERPLKIFLGYDFSTTSDAALRWVNTLRKIGRCEITVGHVYWPPEETGRLGIGGHTGFGKAPREIREVLERDLKEKVRSVLGEENIGIRVAASWGRADLQLIESASAEKADLIAVGTHQRHGLDRFWLGSVSRGVLHHAPMSVAVVPLSEASHQESAGIRELRRVLVPSDFSELGNRAIPYAYSALRRGSTICLLHVAKPKNDEGQLKQQNNNKRKLLSLIPTDAEAQGIETQVEIVQSGKPSQAICQAAERFGADLICMASAGRSGLSKTILGSVVQDVLRCSKRPLLLVR
jgi:nucleotide-binding universal stress UspA family protein